VRYLQTSGDARSIAKDRSGALDPLEPADLGAVVAKMAAHAGAAVIPATKESDHV
jgi:hypothetical protein